MKSSAENRRRRRRRIIVAVITFTAMLLGTGITYAVSNWTVGLNGGSSGEAQSDTVANLTITATASPAAGNLLYPGSAGDVVISISNSNPYSVTISAVQLPANTTYATGYSNSALSAAQTGCNGSQSLVGWNFATGSSGSSHTLTTALVVGASAAANNPLVVTLTNDASMGLSSPAACEATYFSMPSLTGVTATAGGTSTTSPATDSWTS